MPLGALGFWRVILDEAQLVSKETSKAAVICSEIWRRHAWIATGTPINAKVTSSKCPLTLPQSSVRVKQVTVAQHIIQVSSDFMEILSNPSRSLPTPVRAHPYHH